MYSTPKQAAITTPRELSCINGASFSSRELIEASLTTGVIDFLDLFSYHHVPNKAYEYADNYRVRLIVCVGLEFSEQGGRKSIGNNPYDVFMLNWDALDYVRLMQLYNVRAGSVNLDIAPNMLYHEQDRICESWHRIDTDQPIYDEEEIRKSLTILYSILSDNGSISLYLPRDNIDEYLNYMKNHLNFSTADIKEEDYKTSYGRIVCLDDLIVRVLARK